MSSLYFGLVVVGLLEATAFQIEHLPTSNTRAAVELHTTSNSGGGGALAASWQTTFSPKYNENFSSLIQKYIIFDLKSESSRGTIWFITSVQSG
jgi:hypothetical protein